MIREPVCVPISSRARFHLCRFHAHCIRTSTRGANTDVRDDIHNVPGRCPTASNFTKSIYIESWIGSKWGHRRPLCHKYLCTAYVHVVRNMEATCSYGTRHCIPMQVQILQSPQPRSYVILKHCTCTCTLGVVRNFIEVQYSIHE
jgi:hypothetical protein